MVLSHQNNWEGHRRLPPLPVVAPPTGSSGGEGTAAARRLPPLLRRIRRLLPVAACHLSPPTARCPPPSPLPQIERGWEEGRGTWRRRRSVEEY
uniref:Uncharacterized protein n=1 Tax=Oryza glumipatula TaxID=40148 RepID=A0A0E0BRV3_9ORYZ